MSTEFPFAQIPPELHVVFGEPVPGTRMHRKVGSQEEIGYWYEVLEKRFGSAISIGGASMFAPVSRAAVHKRIKEGKLTCFLYDISRRKRNLFGTSTKVRELEVAMVLVSECKAWGKEIERRAIEQGYVTAEELRGDRPDWVGEFLEPDSRWEKKQRRKAKGEKK